MPVLALESSCDETAAAVTDGPLVLAEAVRSQVDLHRRYGGVVPEIASRAHLEAVDALASEVLERSGKRLSDLDGIAVTQGPGLVGALLVALSFAKGLSLAAGLPATGVNHVKAHALAPFLIARTGGTARAPGGGGGPGAPAAPGEPGFPLVALVASGGHTSLFLMEDLLTFRTLGRTLDDAAGEAFDKSAKLMGLGYPGGAVIERMAERGDPEAYRISRPMLRDGLDFSFSGLKTRVADLYRAHGLDRAPDGARELCDLAASFQAAAVEVMAAKLEAAVRATGAKGAVLAGGVAANGALRRAAAAACGRLGVALHVPRPSWCADNAAMIGYLGALQLARGENPLAPESEARTRWPAECPP
ncbi:MAG: tRNA (adenosine(37)-N6)-threonylcarbamoyltransferase complex transferase subunit TsaD [Deltaproteobacteria bacterium]|jgi:N6-L-threonylcarbamoyladenine synthase|nr:tRNA (adenosine(37)-N6)-threonylcarbamoyltransferase complex transferase subunit TsaD [Deltaproteobacteria bacterium]